MSFKIRKISALFLTVANVFVALWLHDYEYGIFISIFSLLMLIVFIWFKYFFAKVVRAPYRNNPVY